MKLWAHKHDDRVHAAKEELKEFPHSPHGVAVPFPIGDKEKYKHKHSNREINEAIEKAPVEKVALHSLHAIQHSVKPDMVKKYIDDPDRVKPGTRSTEHGGLVDLPVVIRQGGKNYLHDGHHRATAAVLTGHHHIEARVVDFDDD